MADRNPLSPRAHRGRRPSRLLPAASVLVVWLGAGVLPASAAEKTPTTQPRTDLAGLLRQFSVSTATPQDRLDAAERILKLGRPAAKRFLPMLQGRERFLRANYQREFQTHATRLRVARMTEAAAKQTKTRAQINVDIRKWRKMVLGLHERPGLTKALIRRQTEEAMARLNELLYVGRQTVLAQTPKLANQREHMLKFTALSQRCAQLAAGRKDAPAPGEPPDPRRTPEGSLADFEDLACLLAMPMVASSRQIILSNAKKESKLRAPEAAGIRDMNRIRFLLGLWALRTDLRLCACARDHCRDMQKHRFIGHDSPVPGKRKPWDRAKLFGTRAGGENVTVGPGPADHKRANQNWFHSPMHFNNLFHKFKYIGLGYDNRYWTQMFGW